MRRFIHEQPEWPRFRWDQAALAQTLGDIRQRQGRLVGRMESLGFTLRGEAELESRTIDVLKTSEIEGEDLDPEQVRSSIARRLGLDIAGVVRADENVEGVVNMTLDATQNLDEPLTPERLFDWHASLFPAGRGSFGKILVGAWRDDAKGPMQVISGAMGKERVHYQAPAADRLNDEVGRFLNWANEPGGTDTVLKAAIGHLWFVTIHPFDDGNGRIARAVADWFLARSDRCPQRFYSMSAQIRHERKTYYDMLERTQTGTLDITPWMTWFLECLGRAFERTEASLVTVLRKARFWEAHGHAMNDRQRGVMNRLFEGFEGKLTTSKYAKLAKCSHDTALRDIQALIDHGILERGPGGGRSTSYRLKTIEL